MKLLKEIRVPAVLENLDAVVRTASKCAEAQGFDEKKRFVIELVTEEAVVNICNYSYPGSSGDIDLKCKSGEDRFIVEITDWGVPFDVRSLPDPDVSADISERPTGGLGVYFMKKMVDDIQYHREEDKNVLDLILLYGGGDGQAA